MRFFKGFNKGKDNNASQYLMCEREWVFHVLTVVAGFYGAFTYLLRGNVFCNAQTGNVVLMGMALGSQDWYKGLYYLIPITAYMMGAFISEIVPNPIKHHMPIRWDTMLIAIEIISVIFLGFVPETAPVQISQVTINFIASMQYNTFRQAEGAPMATTFVTNHIRQIGIGLAKEVQHVGRADKTHRKKLAKHSKELFFFLLGAITGTVFCNRMLGRAIWITLIPLVFILIVFLYADLKLEKDKLNETPAGH